MATNILWMVLALCGVVCALALTGVAVWRSRRLLGRPVTVHLDNGDAVDGLLMGRGLRTMRLTNAATHTREHGVVPMDGDWLIVEIRRVTVWQVRS